MALEAGCACSAHGTAPHSNHCTVLNNDSLEFDVLQIEMALEAGLGEMGSKDTAASRKAERVVRCWTVARKCLKLYHVVRSDEAGATVLAWLEVVF